MREAVIVGAARTPIGKLNGGLQDVPPENFAALVMKEALERSGLKDYESIDDVIFGNVMGAVNCMARMALLKAGLPLSIPGLTVDRQCGSGSTAINVAAVHIQGGAGDVYLAGGVGSMIRKPYILEKPSMGYQWNAPNWLEVLPLAPEEIGDPPMGITAENIAERWQVSREEQDEFSYLSQKKAQRAIEEGRFKEQIVSVTIPQRKSDPIIFSQDEHPRFGTTREKLAKLRPVFKPDGTVTAGNSSGINDGAGAVVIMSKEKAEELSLKPLVSVKGFAYGAVDPNIMGMGPVPATQKVLQKTGLTIDDFDVIEMNEAFASQSIACCRDLGIDWRDGDKVNPNGGAIALGHPVGGSLAILVVKAIYELKRRNGRYALITACCGGGQGVATIIESL